MNTKERGLTLLGRYLKLNETEINELREKIKNLTYNRKHQLLNFTILGHGRVILDYFQQVLFLNIIDKTHYI